MNRKIVVLICLWFLLLLSGTYGVYHTYQPKFETSVDLLVVPTPEQNETIAQKTVISYLHSKSFHHQLGLSTNKKHLSLNFEDESLFLSLSIHASTKQRVEELTAKLCSTLTEGSPLKYELTVVSDPTQFPITRIDLPFSYRLGIWIASITILFLSLLPLVRRL